MWHDSYFSQDMKIKSWKKENQGIFKYLNTACVTQLYCESFILAARSHCGGTRRGLTVVTGQGHRLPGQTHSRRTQTHLHAHKHTCACVHDNTCTPTDRQTSGSVDNSVRHKSPNVERQKNPRKHVILRAPVWNALFKVNKDLKLLKPILICGSRGRLWLARLSVLTVHSLWEIQILGSQGGK